MTNEKKEKTVQTREEFLECILPELVNAKANEKDLADMPHRAFLSEMAIRYSHCAEVDGVAIRLHITNGIAEAMGVTEEDLHDAAVRNVAGAAVILSATALGFNPDDDNLIMLVVTTEYGDFGAAAILNEDVRRELAGIFFGGFIAIPSSMHEFICVPFEDGVFDELRGFIRTINDCGDDSIIKKSDVLAYTPLRCDAQTLELLEVKA